MRNLFLKDYYQLKLSTETSCIVDFDELSYILYVLNQEKTLSSYQINKENPLLFKLLYSKDLSQECENQGKALNIKYILEIDSVIIIFEGGDILKYQFQKAEAENVGSIENGISAALWSPNQEHLLIASNNKTLILLDVHLDLIKEVPLDDDEALIKDANMKTQRVSIVWREDSKFLSTNFPTPKGRKILTRDLNLKTVTSAAKADDDGVVKSVSEKPLPDLKAEIEWIPNGSLMVGVEAKNNEQRVIFWEKNGLNHGEFALDNSPNIAKISALKCSKDSEILAIVLTGEKDKETQSCLFYIRSNFRWYLKRAVYLKSEAICGLFWGSKAKKRLLVVYQNASCEFFDFNLDYKSNAADFVEEADLGVYCSVDNRSALVTNFSKAVIPPPMCDLDVKSSCCIHSFCIEKNFVLLINDLFFEFCFLLDNGRKLSITKVPNQIIKGPNQPRHALFLIDSEFNELSPEKEGTLGNLVFIMNQDENPYIFDINFHYKGSEITISQTFQHKLFHNIVALCANGTHFSNIKSGEASLFVYAQYQNGNVYKYLLGQSQGFPFEKILDITTTFNTICAAKIEINEMVFGLSENNRLYYNSKIISTECTSFTVSGGFLLFTANSPGMYHLLYVFDLSSPTSFLHNNEDNLAYLLPKADSKAINVRNIERGAKIVKVINEKVVFQLPRGNLETIYSKILVLKKFRHLMLDRKKYRQAFELLRQHKLEMNLVFDLNPKHFINKAEEIIKDIEKNDYINLFLSSVSNEISENLAYVLKPEEVKEVKEFIISQTAANKNWKVNLICELTKAALEKIDKDRYILSIMTTYLKKIPNEIEQCLETIRHFKQIESISQHNKQNIPPHLNPETKKKYPSEKKVLANDILEYVCWLADPEKMYEYALGTCDLDLVAMVAVQTQKDPKEYIPYLESLRQVENEIDRKVKIYMDLKKFDNAVTVLASGDQKHWKIALELIQKHGLFNLGMKSFRENPEILLKIKELLGDYVLSKKDYTQAGLLYLSAKNPQKALESYKANGDWKEVLHLADVLNFDQEKKNCIRMEMLEYLNSLGKHTSVGLLQMHLNRESEALNAFIKANDWENIMKLDQSSENQAQIRTNLILPQLKLAHNLKMNLLKQQRTDFKIRLERLLIVQENKKNMPLMFSGMGASGNPMIDNETSSESSFQSKSSYMSVKSMGGTKRRQKKKKAGKKRTIKEGSLKEEDQIVDYLKDIKLSKSVFEEIEALIQCLIYFDLPELGTELYEEMKGYLSETNVFPKSLAQMAFEKENPQLSELYPNNDDFKPGVKTPAEIESYFSKYDYLLRK